MRKIIKFDAINWLKLQSDNSLDHIVSGICDMDECGMGFDEYISFFKSVVELMTKKLDKNGYLILIQTDRKYNRQWISKSNMITEIALKNGLKMIWHKIVLTRDVGKIDLFRPTYSHMLCYSVDGTTGSATPDVISGGKKIYKNATPINAAMTALRFVRKYSKVRDPTIYDPFVGKGTIAGISNYLGMNAVGIDIDETQVKIANAYRFIS